MATAGTHAMARISAATGTKTPARPTERLERFLLLRDELHVVVLFLGGIVGAVTLGSGALRHALISRGGTDPDSFPPESVLAYGAYFTLLLAAAYVPAYRAVTPFGERIRDDICGQLPEDPQDPRAWSEWQSRREPVEEFLQLRVTAVQRFQTALAILAPVVGSGVPLLLGLGDPKS